MKAQPQPRRAALIEATSIFFIPIIASNARFASRPAIHPGEILADELEEFGITPTEFARQLTVPSSRITQIIRGKRAIIGDTAPQLGHWFGISAQFWLNLQSTYDIKVAQSLAGGEIGEKRLTARASS